jgi:hypothetical protein
MATQTQSKRQPSEYEVRVNEWLAAHGIEVEIVPTGEHEGLPPGEKPEKGRKPLWHDVYHATFTRSQVVNEKWKQLQYIVPAFYQSAAHSRADQKRKDPHSCRCERTVIHARHCPLFFEFRAATAYDILASSTLYDPGTFEDFCGDCGYDTDSRRAMDVYLAVQKDWSAVCAFFTEEERAELAEVAS